MTMANSAEATENMVAPRASPEPCLIAYSQNALAITYPINEQIQNIGLFFNDHSFAKISAINSNTMRRVSGNIHMGILLVRPAGFEPTTAWFEAKYSIQLSYGRVTIRLK